MNYTYTYFMYMYTYNNPIVSTVLTNMIHKRHRKDIITFNFIYIFCQMFLFQLIEAENIKAVVSMNENYELSLLSNRQEVCGCIYN